MTLAQGGVGEARVVYLEGDLDMSAEEDVVAELESAVAGRRDVVVDLGAVPFLDSSGIRALLRGREAAQRRGVRLTVRNPHPIVREVLTVTGVASLFGLPGPA